MYSQQLNDLIEGRKFVLTLFWLIVPFEALTFSVLAFILKMSMPTPALEINLNILYGAGAIASLSAIATGAFIRSMFFRQQLRFNQPAPDFARGPETQILASLSTPEKVVILAYRTNISLFVAANSLISFPVVMGMILTILSGQTLPIAIAVAISLASWKLLMPMPAAFINLFHKNIDPQYVEFLRTQNH